MLVDGSYGGSGCCCEQGRDIVTVVGVARLEGRIVRRPAKGLPLAIGVDAAGKGTGAILARGGRVGRITSRGGGLAEGGEGEDGTREAIRGRILQA